MFTRLTVENFNKVRKMFNYSGPTEGQYAKKYIIPIPGMARKLLPIQAHLVLQTLLLQDETVGVFHSHTMGTGKCTITIACYVVRHCINAMYEEIRQFPDNHLQPDQRNSHP